MSAAAEPELWQGFVKPQKDGRITIPKALCDRRGWGKGTKFRYDVDEDGRILLTPVES